MRQRPGIFALVFILVMLCSLWGPPFGAFASGQKVLNLSDIHFNPFDRQFLVSDLQNSAAAQWKGIFESSGKNPLCSIGDETNYGLLDSSLRAMAAALPKPDYILLTGDLLAHDFSERYQKATGDQTEAGLRSFIKKTVTFMADLISGTFRGRTVYFILGNNDSYNGDYRIAPEGEFLKDAAQIIAGEFLSESDRQGFVSTFSVGGYYSLGLAHRGTRVIGLNSNFFSKNYSDPGETVVDYDPGLQELAWLESELARAKAGGEKVILLCHIPPGVDVYGTLHDPGNSIDAVNRVSGMWKPQYLEKFLELLGRYHSTIGAVYSGHTHMDDFRLFFLPDYPLQPAAFVHIAPAVSPQFGNNPGFKVLEIQSSDLGLLDSQTHYLNLSGGGDAWSLEYSFNQAYGLNGINIFSLNRLHGLMAWDARVQNLYMEHYKVSNLAAPFKRKELRAYWTGISCLTADDFRRVYNSSPDAPKTSSRSADSPLAPSSAWVRTALAAP